MTDESKIEEFESSIRLLQALNASLKLVISGNHDFTLDGPVFWQRVQASRPRLDNKQIKRTYGAFGDAKRLFKHGGITFLDEGNHSFRLQNGALLNTYASPYTPSEKHGGFQYHPKFVHQFLCTGTRTGTGTGTGIDESFPRNIDVVMTHGPPKGIMDVARYGEQAGCPYLFKAVARVRPLMHCFGHVHEGWGAKLVTWRRYTSMEPSHLTDIDNEKSLLIENLSTIEEKQTIEDRTQYCTTSHLSSDPHPLSRGGQTLFVNAAFKGTGGFRRQPPWFVDLDFCSA